MDDKLKDSYIESALIALHEATALALQEPADGPATRPLVENYLGLLIGTETENRYPTPAGREGGYWIETEPALRIVATGEILDDDPAGAEGRFTTDLKPTDAGFQFTIGPEDGTITDGTVYHAVLFGTPPASDEWIETINADYRNGFEAVGHCVSEVLSRVGYELDPEAITEAIIRRAATQRGVPHETIVALGASDMMRVTWPDEAANWMTAIAYPGGEVVMPLIAGPLAKDALASFTEWAEEDK